jgi:DNA mismatch repair protein MutS2
MDPRNLRRLEFEKILEQLAACAGSPLGRELALALNPTDDPDEVRLRQSQTTEGRELLRLEPSLEWGGWYDVRVRVRRAGQGIILEPVDFLEIADTLAASRRLGSFFAGRSEQYPLLAGIAAELGDFTPLEKELQRAVIPPGEVADRASSELSSIRRRLVSCRQQVKERLESIIRSPAHQKYLQDLLVTMREGRYVVPVKVEYRAQFPGIVHDQSASGATLFIEPMSVVEANNEVRRLQIAERQEVARILAALTGAVAERGPELSASLKALGQLDFIMARSRYSLRLNAWEPEIIDGAWLDLKKGRHPLLTGEVVPINISLGKDFDVLVITGPNTGGKTVTLKTVGLLALMAQSGLHIPAEAGAQMGVFSEVYADIGDEQSIEQSLSTFSSHMTNIVGILKSATTGSLVLLDELGAGTDPMEGAALAQAILEQLQAMGAKTVATTHYSELKNFALTRERVENASVEFDTLTLRPTYRLLIGKPGRSNAFEIASRLGLAGKVVERAGDFLSEEQIQVAELMHNLEEARQEAERERTEAERLYRDALTIKERYGKMEEDLRSKREAVLAKSHEQAMELVRKARMEAEAAIKEMRQKLSSDLTRDREAAVREAREKLALLQEHQRKKAPQKRYDGKAPAELRPGQEVFVPRFNQRGIVLEQPGAGGEVQVQVGIIKVSLPVQELRQAEESRPAGGGTKLAGMLQSKVRDISTSLDLRGLRAEEALLEVEKYLDDAMLAGLSRVYLIHGKGTGALRTVIHRELSQHRGVKSYRLGEHGEGGSGATVVELA